MDKVIAVLRSELAGLDEYRLRLLQMLAIAEGSEAEQPTPDSPTPSPSRGLSGKTIALHRAVENALTRRRAPMKLSELLEEVAKSGVEVGGKSPPATLGAALRRSDKFQSISGVGWWFQDQEAPSQAEKTAGDDTLGLVSPPASFERRPNGTVEPSAQGREAVSG